MRRIQTGREQYEALNPLPWRVADNNYDPAVYKKTDQLQQEFTDWWAKRVKDNGWSTALGDDTYQPRPPFNSWEDIERFLKDIYPEAHRGLSMGQERAQPLIDQQVGRFGDPIPEEKPYETGQEAIAQHGYDPKETVAGMLLLHNEAHGYRQDLAQMDHDRLYDIAQTRSKMQRDYEKKNQGKKPELVTARRLLVAAFQAHDQANSLPWKIAGKVPQGYQVVPSENGKAWNAYHDSGTYVGGIFVSTDKHTGQRYVSDIKVKPDHRRQGIASALWEAAGRPLHTPLEQTPEGAAWAKSVGGEDIQGDDYEPQKRQANSLPWKIAAESAPSLQNLWGDYSEWHHKQRKQDLFLDSPKESIQYWGNVEKYLGNRHRLSPNDPSAFYSHPVTMQMAKLHSLAQNKNYSDQYGDMEDDDLLQGAALGLLKIRRNASPQQRQANWLISAELRIAAAMSVDFLNGLNEKFHDWSGNGCCGPSDHPRDCSVGDWPTVENFFQEEFPAAHRGFDMCLEEARPLVRGEENTLEKEFPTYFKANPRDYSADAPYETGPEAEAKHGYDPRNVAAGMVLLHNRTNGMWQDRDDETAQDVDLLNNIFRTRMKMQRAYDSRQNQDRELVTAGRLAAVNQEMVDGLNTQFHDWWGNQKPSGGSVDDFAMSDFMDEDRGPIGHWPNIENFLKEKYPAAHKGLGMGLEAEWSLDGHSKPYLTGPEAIKQHGYDPSEIAAGMLLLHNQSDPFRGDMAQQDQDRLNDIAQKRFKMQRNYDSRQTQPAAKELVTANRVVREAMRLMATAPTLPQTGIIEPPQDLSPEDERRVISEINDHLSYSRPRAAAELWAQSGIPLSNLTRSEEIASHIRLWGFPQGIDSDWAQAELDDYTLDNYRRDPSNPLPRNHNEIDWENLPPQEQEGDLGSFEEAFGDAQMEDDESDDGGTEFGDYWYDSANFPNENSDGYARHRAIAHDDPSLWRDEVNNRVNRLLSTNQEEQAAYYWNFVRPRVDFTDLDRGALLQQHHEQYFNPDGSERYNGDEDDDEDSWGNELLPTDPKAPVENTTDPNAKLKSPWYKKVQHYPSGELPSEFSKRRLYDDFNFGEPGVANDSPSGGWHLFRPNEGVYQINDSRRPLHNPPVGYVHYEADHDDKSVKIKYLDVHPKKRGQGVATALVSALAEDFPDYKIAPGSTTSHGTGFVNYMQKNAPGAKERLDTDQWSPAPPNRLTDEQLNEWGVTKRRSPVFAFIDRHNARVAMRRMRIAAFNQELIDRLRGEYHDWYDENGNEALNWAGRGPLGNWRQIENFMKTKYPAAHRGLNAGQESVMPLLDFGSRVLSPLNGQKDTTAPYETGPEAFKQYGYDPKEVAAGMLLLHNQSHPQRGDMLDYDIDRLSDIAQKRSEMQRNYEQRQPQPITAALDLLRMANRIAGSRIT